MVSPNWALIFTVFVLPVLIGASLIVCAIRIRRRWFQILAGVFGSGFLLISLICAAEYLPYLWAIHLEHEWRLAKPTTQAELEAHLSLYSKCDIQPVQSDWGRDYVLKPGERMTQYLLLWNAPLDVVYTRSNTIVAIYTSYE